MVASSQEDYHEEDALVLVKSFSKLFVWRHVYVCSLLLNWILLTKI